jgi:hypothetical protein
MSFHSVIELHKYQRSYLCLERDAMLESFLRVQWYPRIVIIVLNQVVLLLGRHGDHTRLQQKRARTLDLE